jgi:hypothetical protein
MKHSPITIPKTELRTHLDQAEAIKRDMTELLRELESKATGQPITKPGGWRHDPTGWANRYSL